MSLHPTDKRRRLGHHLFAPGPLGHQEDHDPYWDVNEDEYEVIQAVLHGHIIDGSGITDLHRHVGDKSGEHGVTDQVLRYKDWKRWKQGPKRIDKLAPEYLHRDRPKPPPKSEETYRNLLSAAGVISPDPPPPRAPKGKRKLIEAERKRKEAELWEEFQEISEAIWSSETMSMDEKKRRTQELNNDWSRLVSEIRGKK